MQLGVLASISISISTGSMFSVYYRPRTSPSEFIVPYAEYINFGETDYAIGTRFKMKFVSEELSFRSLAGTVVGTHLGGLVQSGDALLSAGMKPLVVLHWKIEPLSITNTCQSSHLPQPKRSRVGNDDSIKHSPHVKQPGVLQGQENNDMCARDRGI